jgi:O-antigen/teichoic acid export membrane protein
MSVLLWGKYTNHPIKIEAFILAQTVSYLITAIVAFAIVKKRTEKMSFKFRTTFSLMILKKSVPFALLILMMTFYYRVDSVMLERMLPDGKTQTGIYAMGYRFFEASNNIAYLFAVLLLPIFSRMLSKHEKVDQLVSLAFRILISGAFFMAFIAWFYGWDILNLRYNSNIEAATGPFQVLMFCFVAIASNYIFGTLLTANGNLKILNIIAFTGMLMNIGLNLILIPKYQVMGCSVASLITQIFTSLAQFAVAVRIFSFKVNKKLITQFIFYLLFLFGIMSLLRLSNFNVWIQIALAIASFLTLVTVSGIINPKSLKLLLKER